MSGAKVVWLGNTMKHEKQQKEKEHMYVRMYREEREA